MEASDAEDELGDWLDEHDVAGGWDLAPILVAGGLDVAWLEQVDEPRSAPATWRRRCAGSPTRSTPSC